MSGWTSETQPAGATISVALCTYNGARFVEEQLASILSQSPRPSQIVVSDDRSFDGTADLVEEELSAWKDQHPDATLTTLIIRNPVRLGVTANFAQAIQACTGDLIALSDQDDVWHPHRLARMVAEFVRRPSLQLLHTDARLVDEGGKPTGATLLATLGVSAADRSAVHEGRAIDPLLRRNVVTGATTMLRRELVDRAAPFPATWVHDEWLAIVAAATGELDLLEDPTIDYRQHGGNEIGASTLDSAGRLGRLKAPRSLRNQRLLDRVETLRARVSGFSPPASDETLRKIAAKLAHERMRSGLPGARLRRIRPILHALRSGDYKRFGLGLQDVLRDLIQPV